MDFIDGTWVPVDYSTDEGYRFVGQGSGSDDADIKTSNSKIKMDEDKQLFAIFELIPLEIILDEAVPEAAPEDITDEELPQTGGIPVEVMSLFGTALMGVGLKLRKRS